MDWKISGHDEINRYETTLLVDVVGSSIWVSDNLRSLVQLKCEERR